MQEHQCLAVFHCFDVHIDHSRCFGGEAGQLEVVSGEQGEGADLVGDVGGARPGERQTVEGAGAAAHLVHEHETLGRGVVENVRRLGHFEHEGRASARQIVRGADAGENAIHGSQHRAAGRHVAADMGQNDDERGLAHVGALAAHIRAGDDQHAARVIEAQVIGYEGLAAGALDHRMAPAVDQQHGLVDQFRLSTIQSGGALGKAVEHIDLRDGGRGRLQRRQA